MITLNNFPKNKDKFIRLLVFFKEILDICNNLNFSPVLDGSFAAFVYTKNRDINVNDVDLSCPEAEFPKIIKVLEEKGISYKLREWHVLQILKDDLKIDLGSAEYWLKDLPIDYETLQIDDYKIKMLSLSSLIEFYKRGIEDRAKKASKDKNEKVKYEALKVKYYALNRIDNNPSTQSKTILFESDEKLIAKLKGSE